MDPTAAFVAGFVAGLAIAVQFGAVSLLLVETAIGAGPRVGAVAGLGVAATDLAFATGAAVGGGAVGAALASHETEIRFGAAFVLAAISLHGLLRLSRGRNGRAEVRSALDAGRPAGLPSGAIGGVFGRFAAITAANPLTIASFAAVAAALSLDGVPAAVAFAVGAGAASAAWHLLLTLVAGHAGRWVTPMLRWRLAVAGRLVVLAIAAHLVLAT